MSALFGIFVVFVLFVLCVLFVVCVVFVLCVLLLLFVTCVVFVIFVLLVCLPPSDGWACILRIIHAPMQWGASVQASAKAQANREQWD